MALEMKYFLLKPKAKQAFDAHARASQKAMLAYAKEIEATDEEFARDLRTWAREEERLQIHMQ